MSKDDIHCTMVTRPFTKEKWPTYVALSYVWGSEAEFGPPRHIYVDGKKFVVGENLYAAIRHRVDFPKPEDPLISWWIDAICINQADNQEKAQQIAMMQNIYRNAMFVLVWLGETTDQSHQALQSNFRSFMTADDRNRTKRRTRPITLAEMHLRDFDGNGGSFSPEQVQASFAKKAEAMRQLTEKDMVAACLGGSGGVPGKGSHRTCRRRPHDLGRLRKESWVALERYVPDWSGPYVFLRACRAIRRPGRANSDPVTPNPRAAG